MHGDESDRDVAGLIAHLLGSRAANQEISRVRSTAATAVVDGAELVASAYGSTEVGPIATALGVADDQVSAVSATGADWCITVEVDRLLATRSIRFHLDADGRLSEIATCAEP